MNTENMLNSLYNIWGDRPEFNICSNIVSGINNSKKKKFSYYDLAEFGDTSFNKTEFHNAIHFLAGPSIRFLKTNFTYIDEHEHSYDIPEYMVKEAYSCGYLTHPKTGKTDENFESKIFLSFRIE